MRALLLCVLLAILVTDASGEDAERLRAARLRARAHLVAGDLEAAARQLGQLHRLQPADRYVRADLASVQRRRGRLDSAQALYRDLYREFPQDTDVRDGLAYLLFERESYAEVVTLMEQLIDDPGHATVDQLQMVAVACDRSGQGARADALYKELLARDPDELRYLLALGQRLLAGDRADEARPYLERARQVAPQDRRVLKSLATALGPGHPDYVTLLLEVIRSDRADPEPPFLIAESLQAREPARAQAFYREALRRIAAAPAGDVWLARMRARSTYRQGDTAGGLAVYDSLLARRPDDASLRLELTELLLETGYASAALDRLPEPIADQRLLRTSGRAHAALGQWAAAVRAWEPVSRAEPADVELRLNLVDAMSRIDRWRPAFHLLRPLRLSDRRDVAERAYEYDLELRRRWGRSVHLEVGHTGLPRERSWRPEVGVRWPIASRGLLRLQGRGGQYDDTAPDSGSPSLRQLQAEAAWAPVPGWEAALGAGWTGGRLTGLADAGARVEGPLPGTPIRGRAVVRVDEPWVEPVDALSAGGRLDRQQLTLSMSVGGWYLSLDGRRRQFGIDGASDLGHDRRLTGYVSRQLWRRPYGSARGLRSLSVTAAHERSHADQPSTASAALRLPPRTSVTTVGLYARFLFGGRGHLDVAPFLGADPERDLGPADVRGLSLAGQIYLTGRLALHGEAFVASENRVQASSGAYRTLRVGLRRDFDPGPDR